MRSSSFKFKRMFTTALLGAAVMSFYACLNPVGNGKSPDGLGLLSKDGDVVTDTSDFTTKVQPIFTARCVSCHKPGGSGYNVTGLDLTSGEAYSNLLGSDETGKPTSELPGTVPLLRVKKGDTTSSYLIQKITSATPKSGGRMPADGTVLSPDEIAIIKTWIQQDSAKGPEGTNP